MIDYHQPGFYRFSEDSLLLVSEIAGRNVTALSLLDIGAGSGVIGIELALKLNIPTVHFLELQREWEPFLSKNIEKFLPGKEIEIFWESVGKWPPGRKYDLIVSNPPYYLPQRGRLSPDPIRARCRSFLEDNWDVLIQKSLEALAPEGRAFFVIARESLSHIQGALKNAVVEILEKGDVSIVVISSPGYKSKS